LVQCESLSQKSEVIDCIVSIDWTQLDRTQTSVTAIITDSRLCARIRPNRMKVSTSLPMEEELAAVKRKKKVKSICVIAYVLLSHAFMPLMIWCS